MITKITIITLVMIAGTMTVSAAQRKMPALVRAGMIGEAVAALTLARITYAMIPTITLP